MTFNPSDILIIVPEIAVLALAMLVILTELLVTRREMVLQIMTTVGLLVVMALAVLTFGKAGGAFNGMIAGDGLSMFMKVLLAGVALLAVLMSRDYLTPLPPPLSPPAIAGGEGHGKKTPPLSSHTIVGGEGVRHGEYYAMVLIATCGMMILVGATDLITVFLGIETMSIALYVLAGIRSERARSSEAALKYFLLGAFATGFLLYGMALLYGATGGKTNLAEIGQAITGLGNEAPVYLYAGVGLVMIGLLFKVAAVPFHFWSPDVYQGAPTPITAFMSAAPKAAALAAFLRVFAGALPDLSAVWGPALWMVAAVTMTLGNLVAIAQKDIKRMLAYSSIAHAGYLLIGVLAAAHPDTQTAATAGIMFYLVAYYLMNIGAFTIAIIVSRARTGGDYQIDDYKGMAAVYPWTSAAMALFMISLAGIPPTAGFFGKLYVFSAAVKAGYITLVVIAVLNSAVSVFYYLRIVVFMYMQPEEKPSKVRLQPAMAVVIIICVLGILKFGLLPGYLMDWAGKSADRMVKPAQQVAAVLKDYDR